MTEYMEEPGVKLGWLIDRKERKVYIYCPGMTTKYLQNPESISGETVLPEFVKYKQRLVKRRENMLEEPIILQMLPDLKMTEEQFQDLRKDTIYSVY